MTDTERIAALEWEIAKLKTELAMLRRTTTRQFYPPFESPEICPNNPPDTPKRGDIRYGMEHSH